MMTLDEALDAAKLYDHEHMRSRNAQMIVVLAAEIERLKLDKDARRDLAKVRAFLIENVAPMGLIERFETIRKGLMK